MSQQKDENHFPKTGFIFVLGFQILILLIYGFFTSYIPTTIHTSSLQYILTNTLATLGFGLLLTYFKFTLKQTMIVALIVCFVNAQLGPLIQAFWYKVFISGFYQTYAIDTTTPYFMLTHQTPVNQIRGINLSFMRISAFCSISLLVALTSVIGKIGMVNSFVTTILFNIGWNLNYYLNYKIYISKGLDSGTHLIMDDYQGSRVFMFGAGFGLALFFIYSNSNKVQRPQNPENAQSVQQVSYTDDFSRLFTLLGSCFVIALFYFVLDIYTPQSRPTALLNVFFAFSGSIVSSIAISCIIGGYISFHHINMTIISGALQISIIGGFIQTPYVSLLVGAFAGILSGVLSYFVQYKINEGHVKDSKGLIIVYLVNCIFCAYFICPIIIKAYKNANSTLDYNEGFYMAYTAISFGIGLVSGIIAGLFKYLIRQKVNFTDSQFFGKHYMEHNIKQRPRHHVREQVESKQELVIHQSRIPPENPLFINI